MKILIIAFLVVTLTSCGNTIKRGGLVEAEKALNRSDYQKALELTDIAESFGTLTREDRAKLHYQRGLAQEGLGKHDEAVDNFRYVVNNHSDSAYSEPSQRRLISLHGK